MYWESPTPPHLCLPLHSSGGRYCESPTPPHLYLPLHSSEGMYWESSKQPRLLPRLLTPPTFIICHSMVVLDLLLVLQISAKHKNTKSCRILYRLTLVYVLQLNLLSRYIDLSNGIGYVKLTRLSLMYFTFNILNPWILCVNKFEIMRLDCIFKFLLQYFEYCYLVNIWTNLDIHNKIHGMKILYLK